MIFLSFNFFNFLTINILHKFYYVNSGKVQETMFFLNIRYCICIQKQCSKNAKNLYILVICDTRIYQFFPLRRVTLFCLDSKHFLCNFFCICYCVFYLTTVAHTYELHKVKYKNIDTLRNATMFKDYKFRVIHKDYSRTCRM